MIENVEIQNVRQSATDEDRMFIYFTTEEHEYYLFLKQNDKGAFVPQTIDHYKNDRCPICYSNYKYLRPCQVLAEYKNELFQRLIEHPSIRLEWLFLNHVSEHKE